MGTNSERACENAIVKVTYKWRNVLSYFNCFDLSLIMHHQLSGVGQKRPILIREEGMSANSRIWEGGRCVLVYKTTFGRS